MLHKNVHLCLIWCRVVRSRDVHPCYMVPHCPVSRCQSQQFWWSRNVQFRVFSRPTPTLTLTLFLSPHPKANRKGIAPFALRRIQIALHRLTFNLYLCLNLECWIKTKDVHGVHAIRGATLSERGCAKACNKKKGCVAFDFNTFELGKGRCRLLKTTTTKATHKKGRIIHFERSDDPLCSDELNKKYFDWPADLWRG